MLDLKFIRQFPDKFKKAMQDRNVDVDANALIAVDAKHRQHIQELEQARAEQNKVTAGPKSPEEIERLKSLKARMRELEDGEKGLAEELRKLVAGLPNIPLDDTPVGKSSTDNVVVREVGGKPKMDFQPRFYLDIAENLGIIDTETAGVVSGSRFGYIKGGAALLEFGLVQLAVSRLTDSKFIKKLVAKKKLNIPATAFVPVVPPVMIRPEMMRAMGFAERAGIPPGNDEMYYLDKDELYLVGTSEQAIGPMHYNKILDDKDLPLRYLGFSTCFRRESGSYGKDTKGILRVHQFDKLEMFTVATQEVSAREHLLMLAVQEALMYELKLPYRVMRLCTGDIGQASASTYDIETWMPGQNEYRETHSTSNTTDFQSRSLNTRIRATEGTKLVHMLNGTAFAVGRMIIAIIENYQTAKGTVKVPTVLQKYMGGLKEIK